MPRFSVIVPVYKVQAYLHECLDSVLEQSYTDFELIVVDDASPDGSAAIIDEFAARDARVKAIHLPENIGLGPARNKGMSQACGEYLIFLDSDDTLTPDALRSVSERLKETDSPDVLVFDYVSAYWDGRLAPNRFSAQLSQEGVGVFELAERPSLLKVMHVVWNKAYRREYIEAEGFTFSPGYYEDVSWTYPVLVRAATITVLDRVCVHYRQRRNGAITRSTGTRHFEVFDQYDRVFAYLDAHPELARWYPHIRRRMLDHFSTVFTVRGRLPRGSHAAFLRKARTVARRHGHRGAPVGLRTAVRHTLVGLGAHRTFRLMWRAQGLAGRFLAMGRATARKVRSALLQVHYRIQLRLPLRSDQAVFSAYWGRGHSCNPGAIEEKVRELAPGIRTSWIVQPAHRHQVPTGTRRLTPNTAAYWSALARSKYLVNNVNFDRRLVKRRGQVFVQTQHGTPLKHMGLDLVDRPLAHGDHDTERMLANCDKWDYVLSSNRHSTLVWERVYPSSYEVLEYGYPRNDRFQSATSLEVARLRESLGIPEGSTAILYAPTHRDYCRSQRPPVDLDRMLRELGPRFTVLTRAHHSYEGPLADGESARLVDVSAHPSVESLCLASDALITDYSSLMFDYANLDRPIVIYADDWEAYEAARGTYFDLRAFPPGTVARSEDELIDIFATGHWRGSRSAQLRAAFRERFCAYDDGRAAERLVRHLFLGQTPGLPPVVPLADRRPVPAVAARVTVPQPAEPTLVAPVPERP
ncbi:bifunctional glycosyltransferase family 2 protein/CDP-glycerol:glycerophosphate glycerophosphotransferase [Streptomyces sp. TRM66268-LWL]|uniref:Bifunctional glycosyltransferase family 2 protein/CDP-glycerol:glycerophosphate glycerophosphotransferase n=1 Tax=Streptomyces polyasparticus TaxID=2767826 RepID=A0ABR7STR4_9ACTN|nr:bifunctional glycosyltransferase family 2 protein/CDP-glycerol:glycerophosphate glycerophosphotransferase [Streptomyces polyasparticus]MBC9718179.1 bifunctional glycosyltransferase family 2 protein/CDP-glycerol:glycerophosphate glycerophosphotransferase [Streptomyces polyasparticus]